MLNKSRAGLAGFSLLPLLALSTGPARAETTETTTDEVRPPAAPVVTMLRPEGRVRQAVLNVERLSPLTGTEGLRSRATAEARLTHFGTGQFPSPVGAVTPFLPPLAIRLGAMLSPRTGFAGGVDFSVPKLALLPGWSTRIDAEAIITGVPNVLTFNFKGFYPLTLNQVYSKGLLAGNKVYGGLGVGPYFGEVTRFGGKVFLGVELLSRIGVEATAHFAGSGEPLFTAQVRFGL